MIIIGIKLKYRHKLVLDIIRVVTPLARLLKEKNVFTSFIANVKNIEQNDITSNSERITYLNLYTLIKYVVDYPFVWDCTKERHAIWKDINNEWANKLTTLNNTDKYIEKLIDIIQKKYNTQVINHGQI